MAEFLMTDNPFNTIESALEFLALFENAIDEAVQDVQDDIALEEPASRRIDALRLVAYKLQKLRGHIASSKRATNDLRTLRRLLLQERVSQLIRQ
jgi:hypothetical protein